MSPVSHQQAFVTTNAHTAQGKQISTTQHKERNFFIFSTFSWFCTWPRTSINGGFAKNLFTNYYLLTNHYSHNALTSNGPWDDLHACYVRIASAQTTNATQKLRRLIKDIVGLSVLRILLLTGEALHHGGPQSGNFPSLAVSIGADVFGVRKPLRVVVRRGPAGVGRVEEPHENRVGICCIGSGCILRLARQHYVHAANLV